MTPQDLRTCKLIHANLASEANRSINFVFMEPVDTTLHPTYSSIVKRPSEYLYIMVCYYFLMRLFSYPLTSTYNVLHLNIHVQYFTQSGFANFIKKS